MHIDALSLAPSLRTHMRTLGDEARITISSLLQDDQVPGNALERLDRGRRSRRGEKRMCVCVSARVCVCV